MVKEHPQPPINVSGIRYNWIIRKERGTMSKMKELFTEQTSIIFDVAECVECGVEIEFADENEFAKLVSEHACVRLV